VWQDRRSADLCDELRDAGWDSRLTAITGLELDPYFVAPKVRWLRDRVGHEPVITTSDVWLLNRMCGAFVTDAATASRTLLLDLDSVSWSSEACSAFGIDVDDLPAIVDNAGPVGETSAFSDKPVPVTGVCVDQQAALFAESCRAAGEAKCTYGTGAFLLTSTGHEPRRSSNGLVGCVAWRQRGETTWCLDGQVYTVGSVVSWLQDIGLISQPSDLDTIGSTATDAGGVTFVPGLAGLGAPFWRASAKGALIGMSLGTTRSHIVRSVIEGIAAQVAWLARAAAADLGSALTALRVDGGLTRSRTLMQVQADLLQAPVEVYPSPNATALGVGAFAQIGAGGNDDAASWSPAAVFEPRVGPDEAEARLKAWRTVVEATSPFDA
jgi:glycerol kinase